VVDLLAELPLHLPAMVAAMAVPVVLPVGAREVILEMAVMVIQRQPQIVVGAAVVALAHVVAVTVVAGLVFSEKVRQAA
jgi:hypothetical protein